MKKTIYVDPQTDVIWLTAFDNVLTGTGNAPSISEDPDADFLDY